MDPGLHRGRAVAVAIAVWIVCIGVIAFLALVYMRECSSRGIVLAVEAIASTALVLLIVLVVTARATPARTAAVVVASWVGLYLANYVCNVPNPETREYLRSLGEPRPGDARGAAFEAEAVRGDRAEASVGVAAE